MLILSIIAILLAPLGAALGRPFFNEVGNSTWIFGNDLFNVTQGPTYAAEATYNGLDIIGTAVGHYAGYDGEDNLQWTSASIVSQGADCIDIAFSSEFGDLHWVLFDDLPGAYQYFVNRALPDLSIFRTLWRLNPKLFLNGRTYLRNQDLPDFSLYANATKVQDETFQIANGTYITKYDWSDYVRDRDFYGIYGPTVGSWYIHPSTEYYDASQLSQTLTVHRESSTGDSVQLNVVQDTSHFRVGNTTPQLPSKVWGPWLWYLNNGSVDDVKRQREQELQKFPYPWLNDTSYHSRGSVTGSLRLSDGRSAAGAAIFLGDQNTTIRPLVQGSNYYYTTYADAAGQFNFTSVRSGSYGLYAWSNGGALADVYTNFTTSDVTVFDDQATNLGELSWKLPSQHSRIFQIGEFDKKALGFENGGFPYQHGLTDLSPANLTYIVGESNVSDWYYAQSALGTWTIQFDLTAEDVLQHSNGSAILTVSLAGYSQSASLDIDVNGQLLGSLSNDNLASDPALYRSGRNSGEWRLFQYSIDTASLNAGTNNIAFTMTRSTQWKGFLWDSIILEWGT
ncbi:MAG: hypothetical protein M1820_009014 [Bogoriella megaspora]|nr:MAG: hypothetical protein M1820_009014 [Bogoriella megaspora]